jgi:hypothetical protein
MFTDAPVSRRTSVVGRVSATGTLPRVTLLYKPFGIVLGIIAGILSKKIFEQIWGIIDEEEPPEATTRDTTWPKVLASAAVEGIAFKVTRAAVDRAGARGFERMTGVWPGPKEPEPE